MAIDAAERGPYWLRPLVCTVVGMVGNLLLTIGKITIGVVAHSNALVADGFHSLADVASDIGVIVVLKASRRPADDNHPYGHHAFETLGALGVAVLICVTGFFIGKDALVDLWTHRFQSPGAAAVVMLLVSVVTKELMARYTLRAARRHKSPVLESNGFMHRSDAVSSLAAAGAVIGARFGVPAFDSIGALVIALFIVRTGWRVGTSHALALVDTMPAPELVAAMERTVAAVPGAQESRDLRVRQRGSTFVVDLRLAVDPAVTVARAHAIAHDVEASLQESFPDVTRVFVHIEPGNRLESDAS
jgi:cation diffusion facilitator family transporter